jgi:BMFP domain-containing protein YqiC
MPKCSTRLVLAFCFLLFIVPSWTSAHQEQNPSPVSGTQKEQQDRLAQLESRVKALEDREQQAVGFHDTDYVLKLEKLYESYYERAFQAQKDTVWAVGLIFTFILAVAGFFSFTVFERKVEFAVADAARQLRAEFDSRMRQELLDLDRAIQDKLGQALQGQKESVDALIREVKQRISYDLQFSQGLTFGMAKKHEAGRRHYSLAIDRYLENKAGMVPKDYCATALANLFREIYFMHEDAGFVKAAKEELTKERYKGLGEELALAAVKLTRLGPILREIGEGER